MITTFKHPSDGSNSKASTFACINGKTYQIIRGYRLNYREIWLYVAGTTALRQADLGKQWDVIGSQCVHVACVSRYFNYLSERADLKLTFVGNDTAASRFLALFSIDRRYGLDLPIDRLIDLSRIQCPCWESYSYGTSYLEDMVSQDSEAKAVHVDFQVLHDKTTAERFLEEITNRKGVTHE